MKNITLASVGCNTGGLPHLLFPYLFSTFTTSRRFYLYLMIMTRNRKGFGVGAVSVQERHSFWRVLQVLITPLNVSCLLPTGPYGQACNQLRKKNTKNNRQYFTIYGAETEVQVYRKKEVGFPMLS